MKKRSPNLIFIVADQLRYSSCGYAGDKYAKTENIDRLAGLGVDAFNAVSSMPVCSAFRATLFTGKYTTSTGMVINELRMNPNHRCFGHVLTDSDYETAYLGKWHLYANELGNHYDPKNSFIPRGPHRLGFDGLWAAYNFHHEYYEGYYHTETVEKIKYQGYEPDSQTDMAISYIDNLCEDKPFALFLNYGTPHDPWEKDNVPKEYYEMFRDTQFEMPPNYKDEMDPQGDPWSNIEKSEQQINEWKRVYYAMVANLDYNVGRLLDCIEKNGIDEDTIIVFTSDHGEMFGAQGRMKKNIFYDEAARIPFIVYQKGKIDGGEKTDVCLNSVDIMPTILSLMGLPYPEEVEGMDVSKSILGIDDTDEPEFAFLQNTGACAMWEDGHEWRGVRDKRYTYALFKANGREELYDRKTDPYCINNLAESLEHSDIKEDLKKKLYSKMSEINDTFEDSTWYRDNWIEDRCIVKTATMDYTKHYDMV